MQALEFELLEKEIKELAKELNIQEKHVQKLLDGTYKAISLTKNSNTGRVVLLTQLPHDPTGKKNNPVIKSTKIDNQEIIDKMERFAQLVRVYKLLKKTEKAKEKLASTRQKTTLALV